MKKRFLSLALLTVIVTACNSGQGGSTGVQNLQQSPAKKGAMSTNIDLDNEKYYALSISQPWLDVYHEENFNIFVANEKGVSIGQMAQNNLNFVRWRQNIPVVGGVNDVKVCPQVDNRMIAVGVGPKGKIILISQTAGRTDLSSFQKYDVTSAMDQKIDWTSVSCVENDDGAFIVLAGHDDEFNPYVAGYTIAGEKLKGTTSISGTEVKVFGYPKELSQLADGSNPVGPSGDFYRVQYVRYENNGNTQLGLVYATKTGEMFTPDLSYIGLRKMNLTTGDDQLYFSIPTADLREDAVATNTIPILNISSIGTARQLDKFSFFIDTLKISGMNLVSDSGSTTTLIEDPLGQDVIPGSKPLIPVFSDATCNDKTHICLFSFHNLDTQHSQSILVGVSSVTGKKLFSKNINVGEDLIVTGIDTIPQSDGEFLELGGKGSLFRRQCLNNVCNVVVEVTHLPPLR